MKFSATVLLGLTSTVAGSQYCNPLFKLFENVNDFDYNNVAVPVYSNQSPVTLSDVEGKFRCPNVEKSCCNATLMDDIATKYTVARAKIIETAAVLENTTDKFAAAEQEFLAAVDELKDANDAVQESLSKALQLFQHIKTWTADTSNAYGKCLDRVLQHHVGFICLACDSEWAKYGSEDMTSGEVSVTLRYKDAACTNIFSDCSGIVDASQKFATSLHDTIMSVLNMASLVEVPELELERPTREDLCNNMLHGFQFTPPLQPMEQAFGYLETIMLLINTQTVGFRREASSDPAYVMIDELSRAIVSAGSIVSESRFLTDRNIESKRFRRNVDQNLVTVYVTESEEASVGAAYDPVGVQTTLDTKTNIGNGGVNNAQVSTSILIVCCTFMFLVNLL
eukprot:CFRG5658T1